MWKYLAYTALSAWEGSGRVTQKAARQKGYMKQLTGNLLCSCSSCCQTVLDQVHLTPFLPTDRTIGKKREFFGFLKKKKTQKPIRHLHLMKLYAPTVDFSMILMP